MKTRNKQRLYVEAFPLLGDNPSGIGKLLYSLIDALLRDPAFTSRYDMILVVSLGKRHHLDKWNFGDRVTIKTIPLPLRGIYLLDRLGLMFPIDAVCGRGVYLFPNYRRLPLLWSRSLTYIHDMSYLLFPDTVQERNLSFLRTVVPRNVKNSDRILTLSRQSYNELQQEFPQYKDKIAIVPAGVDAVMYACKDNAETIKSILNEVGVTPKKYLLFVGNFEPRKNIDYLLDVYVELRKHAAHKDLSLLLVGGDGWRSGETARRIVELNRQGYSIVRPVSRVPDVHLPALYHESLATLLLSVYEGFGMTPLEALSADARVIVSDIPVLHEVGGDAVSYVPLDDASSAAALIKDAVNRSVNHDATARRLGMFTWEKAATALIHVLDEVAEKKR